LVVVGVVLVVLVVGVVVLTSEASLEIRYVKDRTILYIQTELQDQQIDGNSAVEHLPSFFPSSEFRKFFAFVISFQYALGYYMANSLPPLL
jgi:hypothetical protein